MIFLVIGVKEKVNLFIIGNDCFKEVIVNNFENFFKKL